MSRKVEKKVEEFLSKWRQFALEIHEEGKTTGQRDQRIGRYLLSQNVIAESGITCIKATWCDGSGLPVEPEATDTDQTNQDGDHGPMTGGGGN